MPRNILKIKQWFWIYSFIFSYLFTNSINFAILLYDTDNLEKTQAYDCIYYDGSIFTEYINPETTQTVKYCIRTDDYISINRNYDQGCLNEGLLVSFEKLKQLNIKMEELLKWNSGVHIVDEYQVYLQ